MSIGAERGSGAEGKNSAERSCGLCLSIDAERESNENGKCGLCSSIDAQLNNEARKCERELRTVFVYSRVYR